MATQPGTPDPGVDTRDDGDVEVAPHARAWVEAVLEARAGACEQLSAGSLSLTEVLDGRCPPELGSIQLLVLLESLPGASKVATRRKLAELGISERATVSELRTHEVALVREAFPIPGRGLDRRDR